MSEVLMCTFTSPNNYLTVKSSSASNSVWIGLIKALNCPGMMFYCDNTAVDSTGRAPSESGYYKILSPSSYKLNVASGSSAFININSAVSNGIIRTSVVQKTNNAAIQEVDTAAQTILSAAVSAASVSVDTSLAQASSILANMEADESTDTSVMAKTIDSIASSSSVDSNEINRMISIVNKITGTNINDSNYNDAVQNTFKSFNKYKIMYPDLHFPKGIPYVIFTRPDLNFYGDTYTSVNKLSQQCANDPVLYGIHNTNPEILLSLTAHLTSAHSFNPFLSNMAQSFDLSDESIETFTTGDTFSGWRVKYAKHNIQSQSSGSFSVSYNDMNDLQVYKMHKAWIEYVSKIYRCELKPKQKYIHEKRLDYACSVYYFVCAPDGETILYWAKYVGVFPTNAPTGSLAWGKGNLITNPEASITYEYSWKSDMELPIFTDFNYNSGMALGASTTSIGYSPNYSNEVLGGGYTFANAPFVYIAKDSNDKYVFKLRFKK